MKWHSKKDVAAIRTACREGQKNKLTRNLVDRVFLEISANLEEQGKGLQECAGQDLKWFFENFLKPMIPKNVLLGGTDPPLPAKIEVVFVKPGFK